MCSNNLLKAEEVIAEFFPTTTVREGRGMRQIVFNGDLICDPERFRKILVALRFVLAFDVAIYAGDGRIYRICIEGGAMFDRLSVIFISNDWTGPEEGGVIPELKITYYQDESGNIFVQEMVETLDSSYAQLQRENEELKQRLARSRSYYHVAINAREGYLANWLRYYVDLAVAEKIREGSSLDPRELILSTLADMYDGKVVSIGGDQQIAVAPYNDGEYTLAITRIKQRIKQQRQDATIYTILRDGGIFKRGKIQHRGAHRALTLAAPGATLEAGTSPPVSCCAHLDWTEPGEDMTKPHHTKCVNYREG